MQSFAEALKAYTRDHPFDAGNDDAETVLDQLYQAYAESHESDPQEISEGFKELECFLETLPLSDNNHRSLGCLFAYSVTSEGAGLQPQTFGYKI